MYLQSMEEKEREVHEFHGADNGGFEADFFGLGPADSKHFDDAEAAADFLAGTSE